MLLGGDYSTCSHRTRATKCHRLPTLLPLVIQNRSTTMCANIMLVDLLSALQEIFIPKQQIDTLDVLNNKRIVILTHRNYLLNNAILLSIPLLVSLLCCDKLATNSSALKLNINIIFISKIVTTISFCNQ